MANLNVLQFKIYSLQKKGELNKKDANFFINSLDALMSHDTLTLEQAIEDMYETLGDYSDFKEQLKCVTVSDNNKFLFDYVDNFQPDYLEIYNAVNEIREELAEEIETR